MEPQVGLSLKDIATGFSSYKKELVEPIKKELRDEIKAGMIKMFLAGVASVIVANFIYAAITKGQK